MKTEISRIALEAIRAHVAAEAPLEACGLLFGSTERIEAVRPARNVAADPARRFEIDPVTLFAAIRAERAGGHRLIGYYHSHPNGRAEPSKTDRAMAAPDGKLWLIAGKDEITAWHAGTSRLVRVELLEV